MTDATRGRQRTVLRGNADGKEAFRRFAAFSNHGGAPAGSSATVATENAVPHDRDHICGSRRELAWINESYRI